MLRQFKKYFLFSAGIILIAYFLYALFLHTETTTNDTNSKKIEANETTIHSVIESSHKPSTQENSSQMNLSSPQPKNTSSANQQIPIGELSDEDFRALIRQYNSRLPKIIHKSKLDLGGDNINASDEQIKKRAYEGDSGAQFLYGNKLAASLMDELAKEYYTTSGQPDMKKWLEKFGEARDFLIKSSVANNDGFPLAELGTSYMVSTNDKVEALSWMILSSHLDYKLLTNICRNRTLDPCSRQQLDEASERALQYLSMYNFDVEK